PGHTLFLKILLQDIEGSSFTTSCPPVEDFHILLVLCIRTLQRQNSQPCNRGCKKKSLKEMMHNSLPENITAAVLDASSHDSASSYLIYNGNILPPIQIFDHHYRAL